ncbi:MAG: TerC family protein [Helicobacteraceae bacterium]|nr:TerC family protein [Helicobacteraceae bacterium]
MFEWIQDPSAWIALLTLTALEIVLGIDNIIFIAILVNKLPSEKREKARIIGLGLAMIMRILLLLSLFWIMKLTTPLFEIFSNEISGRDLILILGGLFLIAKSTTEIHDDIEGITEEDREDNKTISFIGTLVQIALLDIIFSLDSVITAVGMVNNVEIMIIAVVVAVIIMMFASKSISDFVDNNHTIKVLALSFLILVGFVLVADGFGVHVPKGYIYSAMAFSLAVESLNIMFRKKRAIIENN